MQVCEGQLARVRGVADAQKHYAVGDYVVDIVGARFDRGLWCGGAREASGELFDFGFDVGEFGF